VTAPDQIRSGYKQTDVGMIPVDWQRVTVADLAARKPNSIVGGPFGSDLVSKDYVPFGVPVIRGQNMGRRFISGDFVFVSQEKAKYLKANTAAPHDIIFTQRGTLGQVSIVPENGFNTYLVSQSQMKLTPDLQRYDPEYLLQFFIRALRGKRWVNETA
jgi:type I restriction enzyme S subunit